jgi:hypothetical protein
MEGAHVGPHDHVAVPAVPRGHRIAIDRVHVDVDGEQVVAALGRVSEHLVDEVLRVDALALKPTLHIGDVHRDRVDASVRHLVAQRLDGQWFGLRHVHS